VSRRCCFDCGATPAEAAFPGTRKPQKRPDRCTACAADPGGAGSIARVVARRKQIAALRAAGRYRAQKPIHTTPLFAGLRMPPAFARGKLLGGSSRPEGPGGEDQHMPAGDAEAGGEK
jgi:hypothetical protein